MVMLLTIFGYILLLMLVSHSTSKRSSNDAFYRGERKSPWYVVAWGMIGASISGVTFVSVPGMVLNTQMTYLQTCLGFILGYALVAFVLLPIYYKLNLTTIYSYLSKRLGKKSYHTGASFFLLSKMTGAAARFYVVCIILQRFVLDEWGIPFWITVPVMVSLIWLYTRKSGIKTLVWTDSLQTLCMFSALALIIYQVMGQLNLGFMDTVKAIANDEHSRIFVMDDWWSKQNFWKQFFSGVFIVIVMTGLDQDMMQKNLTCSSLRDAQKDMCAYSVAFVPANLLFLSLGVLLLLLAQQRGVAIPTAGDELLPMFASTGLLGQSVLVLFTLGIIAAAFSSADSALTALTTSFCVDICEREGDERLRKRVHIIMAMVFIAFILLFRLVNSTSVIDAIYVMCGYTYGPLLGLFAYGLLTKKSTHDPLVPYICVASPLICFAIDYMAGELWGYRFGYELLMLNGLLTFLGLYTLSFHKKE
ncbi:MAG: sodium:solute symporter [Prevotella sp.]|nr:sodium:solute symporter [Prevotella sp.]